MPKKESKEKKESRSSRTERAYGLETLSKIRPKHLIAAVIVLVLALSIYYIASNYVETPFTTFKANFDSASRVAVVVTGNNATQQGAMTFCFTYVIESIAHHRKPNTIDFFMINPANNTCVYSSNGLGYPISISNESASSCANMANSEPGIFMNYSAYNYTNIKLFHMYVYGNSEYMAACPLGPEFS